MLFDNPLSVKKCLSGKVICAFFGPAYRSSPVMSIDSQESKIKNLLLVNCNVKSVHLIETVLNLVRIRRLNLLQSNLFKRDVCKRESGLSGTQSFAS
jgi:hypothetical protein